MFKILNFQNKFVEKLLVFRCSEIPDTKYERRETINMQNKANFRKVQMNVNPILAKDYDNETAFRLRKNKPNQSQFQKGHLLIDRTKWIYYYGIW